MSTNLDGTTANAILATNHTRSHSTRIITIFSAKVSQLHWVRLIGSLIFVDIDECLSPLLNTCPSSSKCINFDGSYRCECNQTVTSEQSVSETCGTCLVNGIEYAHDQRWPLSSDSCTTCHCVEGVVNCTQMECNCSSVTSQTDSQCCPQCNHDKSCPHQEDRHKRFKSGQRWDYDCQTCECMVSVTI